MKCGREILARACPYENCGAKCQARLFKRGGPVTCAARLLAAAAARNCYNKKDMSIFSKLFKLFITVVLMPLIPMALLLAYYQNRQKDNILETHYNLAEIISYNIKRSASELNGRLAFARRLPVLMQEDEASAVEFLQNALDSNPDFLFLAVLDASGQEIVRAARAAQTWSQEKISFSSEDLPNMARQPRLYLTSLEMLDGVPAAEFLRPMGKDGFLYGVMSLYDTLDGLQQLRIGRTGQIYLADAAGNIYVLPSQWGPDVKPAALKECLAGESRFIKNLKGTEETYVGAFAPVNVFDIYSIVLQPKAEAFRSLYFSDIVIILFLLAIATLAYFGALTFSRSLGEPIAALAEGARQVSRGNLDHRVSEEEGWGEFEQLIKSFNKMTADLKDYQALQLKNQVSEMKEQVFRAVAHDLRAPLLGLQGYIYILSSGKITEEQHAEYLQRMDEAAKNLSSLLEDVLSVSRVEAGMALPQRQQVELEPVMQNVLNTLRPAAQEKGLDLQTEVPSGLCVWADPKLLRRIMTNLLSNAVKFTKDGFVRLAAREEESSIVISVQDTGVGLTEKQQKEIFEKYRQVDEQTEGYGLGLFISRQLARAHGGDLTVSSQSGKGSTFTLTLPKEEA